jgi:hypothetical protein
MWRLRQFLTRNVRSDRADSVLVPAMILLPVLALIIGGAVEIQKNNYVRTERVNAMQDSVSSAVTLTNSQGSLDWRVVDRIVNEYEYHRFGGQKFSSTYNNEADRPLSEKNIDTAESKALEDFSGGDQCLGGSTASETFPKYKITLDNVRGAAGANPDRLGDSASVAMFSRTAPSIYTSNPKRNLKPGVVYNSVTVEITDQTPNMFLGVVGMPCQKFVLEASAVTFSADADLVR